MRPDLRLEARPDAGHGGIYLRLGEGPIPRSQDEAISQALLSCVERRPAIQVEQA